MKKGSYPLTKNPFLKDDLKEGIKVIMPRVNKAMIESEGYKKLLDVLEVLQPGSRDKLIQHAEKEKGSVH